MFNKHLNVEAVVNFPGLISRISRIYRVIYRVTLLKLSLLKENIISSDIKEVNVRFTTVLLNALNDH